MKIVEYADRAMLCIELANVLAGELESWLLNHDHASFAVPGGTTPGPIFDRLCAADLDWSRVTVMPTDERWVPDDHERSNARLIHARLLTERAAQAPYMPFYRDGFKPEDAVAQLNAGMAGELPISVLLLGMGGDMHCASLFPDAPDLAAALAPDAPPLSVQSPPSQTETRITLNAAVLDGAMNKHLVIMGDHKRAALERATTLSPEEAPVAAVLQDMTVHWAS
ncbi:MAG: 6-phosphogluconolactonase [Rhodobacteraceae bacterium]|nr:6-phosphogluconolactonase [Paracoccaceae bacterium]